MTIEAFPGALGAEQYMKRTVEALAPHGLDPERTLGMAALCRDELTVELTRRISEAWGYPFRLGSLAGMVLTGKSGLAAALAHAPKIEGRQRTVVYAMPHIGINEDGTVGSFHRLGQNGATTACGALVRFRTELANGQLITGLDQYDVEMSIIRQRLVPALRYGAVPSIIELTAIARDVILDDLLHIGELVPGWAEADVAVFSGIQIHTADGDFVQPGRSILRPGGAATTIPLDL